MQKFDYVEQLLRISEHPQFASFFIGVPNTSMLNEVRARLNVAFPPIDKHAAALFNWRSNGIHLKVGINGCSMIGTRIDYALIFVPISVEEPICDWIKYSVHTRLERYGICHIIYQFNE